MVGICEPMNPGGHGAWGADLTCEGAPHQHYGGYLGRKKTMSVFYATAFGLVQAARIVRHLAKPEDTATISSTLEYVVDFMKGNSPKDQHEDAIPLQKRFRAAMQGFQATIGVVNKDWALDADRAARQAVWDAIKKWPNHGVMCDVDPEAKPVPPPAAKKITLDCFGGEPQ